ncbi:MAG: DNA/RNA nuclease SfsA [Bacillota bacterium]|nr:DNA/RNA nuclease SfsA [Bacillota bacterium]
MKMGDVVLPARTTDDGAPSTMPCIKRDGVLIRGTFVSRPNRFLATVRLESWVEPDEGLAGRGAGWGCSATWSGTRGDTSGSTKGAAWCRDVSVHVADPGRLKELLVPGRTVYVTRAVGGSRGGPGGGSSLPGPGAARGGRRRASSRKTAYDLALVDLDGLLVSVDSRVPNELVFAALGAGFFPDLAGYPEVQREYAYGESRIDFRLSGPLAADCLVEVKSVTLVRGGRAMFPDAPTARGARHMQELARAAAEGLRAMVVFVIQRPDASSLSPNDDTDPTFGEALRAAARSGVKVRAYTCETGIDRICLDQEVPVILQAWV